MTTKAPYKMPSKTSAELLRRSVPAQSWQLASPQPMLRITDMSPYCPTRREFLIGAGGLLLLAPYGCGGGTGGEEESEGTKRMEHALGEVGVPENPRRVAWLGTDPQNLLALGTKPVGTAFWATDNMFPNFLDKGETEGMALVGNYGQPNIEKIASLNPDLILGAFYHEEIYDQLSQIAPTALFFEQEWNEGLRKNELLWQARALGRTGVAERLLGEYEGRIADFRRRMGDRMGGLEVSFVHFSPGDGEVQLYMKNTWSGVILEEAGLSRPPSQDKKDFMKPISLELIPELDADVLFYTLSGSDDSLLEKFTNNPPWRRLGAVRQGSAHEVGYQVWIGYSGIRSANLLFDDLEKYLLEKPVEKSPKDHDRCRPTGPRRSRPARAWCSADRGQGSNPLRRGRYATGRSRPENAAPDKTPRRAERQGPPGTGDRLDQSRSPGREPRDRRGRGSAYGECRMRSEVASP